METLIKHERFEMELLEHLNSIRAIEALVFTGGTMLRLCYGLDRFSVDLDFWLTKKMDTKQLHIRIMKSFEGKYSIKDAANKRYTMLYEIASRHYPRCLKVEIRKEVKPVKYRKAIAFSKHSTVQVFLNTVDLQDMMQMKMNAFLNRGEIRDCYDIEFLFKKGIPLYNTQNFNDETRKKLSQLLSKIDLLTPHDYKVKLGSIILYPMRKYYLDSNFSILKNEIKKLFNTPPVIP